MRVEDTTEQNRVEAERARAARVRAMKEITVGLADCRISNDPASVLVTHALGSCVAVAIHDPVAGVAGLLHLMLPESALDPAKAAVRPYQFADTGIPLMFHAA